MERLVLTAPDISCEHCINAIDRAVGSLEGAKMLEGNPDTKQVIVEFDASKATLDQIKEAMEEEGFRLLPAGRRTRAIIPVTALSTDQESRKGEPQRRRR